MTVKFNDGGSSVRANDQFWIFDRNTDFWHSNLSPQKRQKEVTVTLARDWLLLFEITI